MIRQIMDLAKECARNPKRLLYHYRIAPHSFFWWYEGRRAGFDLGQPVDKPLSLHVILRTTDGVMNMNAKRNLEDLGIRTKRDVIAKGGCSLFGAAKRFVEMFGRDRLRLTLVLDNMSDVGLALYRECAAGVGLDFDIVQSKGHGNGPSFQTQIDVALKDDDSTIELIFEDDYMMSEDALVYPFKIFCEHSRVAGFNPHFHPDRIRRQDIGKLAVLEKRLLGRVSSTCCTFFVRHDVLKKYESRLRLYDGCEIGTVNALWRREICLEPLGWTLAEHLHRSDLSPTQTLVS